MSLGLWCVGVEFGDGGRRRGEGQVETCRVDGSGAVKDGCEAWTDGPEGWMTSRSGFHGFGPQNPGGGFEERTPRGGIKELASRLSYLMKGAVAVRSRLCRVRLECPCG